MCGVNEHILRMRVCVCPRPCAQEGGRTPTHPPPHHIIPRVQSGIGGELSHNELDSVRPKDVIRFNGPVCVLVQCLRPHGLQPARLLCPQGFSRQKYWSGLPCLSPGDLPNPGVEPRPPALQADSLSFELTQSLPSTCPLKLSVDKSLNELVEVRFFFSFFSFKFN